MKKQDKTVNAAIGGRLKEHRKRLGFTAESLAEAVGVTPRFIQDLERGAVGMSTQTLMSLCVVLKISADALLFGETAGIDALLRGADRKTIEHIEELVRLQLKIIHQPHD